MQQDNEQVGLLLRRKIRKYKLYVLGTDVATLIATLIMTVIFLKDYQSIPVMYEVWTIFNVITQFLCFVHELFMIIFMFNLDYTAIQNLADINTALEANTNMMRWKWITRCLIITNYILGGFALHNLNETVGFDIKLWYGLGLVLLSYHRILRKILFGLVLALYGITYGYWLYVKISNITINIPVFKYDPSNELHKKNDQCSICITNYEAGEGIKILDCKHMFHAECIDPWFAKSQTCPLCRTSTQTEVDKLIVQEGII